MNNDLAYSVFVENKHNHNKNNKNENTTEPLRYTLPKRVHKWVDDNSVTSCYNCTATFSLFFRRHHCRFCGKVFCSNCVKYNAMIPEDLLSDDSKEGTWNEYLSSYISKKSTNSHKVCKNCKDIITFIDSVKHVIEVFLILNLDIRALKLIGRVCKPWHYASNYILSIFKEIQYKLPDCEYTELEKKLLMNNIQYLSGHNRYLVHSVRACNTNDEYAKIIKLSNNKRKVACWSMMCNRQCQSMLTSFDAIDLLCFSFKNVGHNDTLKNFALDFLRCSDSEFKCYLPLLVYYLNYDNGILSEFLVKRCINNFTLLNSLYWELQLHTKDSSHSVAHTTVLNKLKDLFKDKNYSGSFVKILEGYSFVKIVENISSEICDKNKKYEEIKDNFKLKGFLTNPINSKNKIQEIFVEKIKIKNSATKPMILPCKTNNGNIINILYKREDVRKDQVMMNVIKLMDIILKKEENLDLDILTYDILPTDKNAGMIEIVDDCDTMFYIREKLCTSITNYILENNDNYTVKNIRDNFIHSTAAYCVMTYLLGVGDRHLDNIMITKGGKLFHIDYGYILGNDPVTSNPGIRITPEIVEAIGGLSSKNYEKFIELSTRIYNCLRRHIGLFMHMLNVLPNISDLKLSKDDINKFLMKRFIPGENTYDANFHLIVQLERQDYVYAIKDWFHYHSQEKTVSSAMTRLTYAMSRLIQYTIPEESIHSTQLKKTVHF
ncbi:phosphoinositide 3-kinase [Indivirus ILV1]|uniref:Phosphoinositide 3-kinase n=1 Tax=Indivirus ILV1 TaxID=1977633 RepID=A0A1V0SEG9_9VIRU|nr:phosphoinositide 3-kinase [Indivirus ILV1]